MKSIFLLFTFLISLSAFSQSHIVSVDAFDLSYVGGLAFRHDEGKRSDRHETEFRLKLNYAQNWEEYVGLMWKVQVNMDRLNREFGSSDVFESSYGVAGGFLFNHEYDNVKNSAFVGALAGIERMNLEYTGVKERSGFNIFATLEGGKRWDLGQYSVANISYAPSVSVTFKRYGGGLRDDYFRTGNEVRLNFLKFDILF
jgi:hypothetical protein